MLHFYNSFKGGAETHAGRGGGGFSSFFRVTEGAGYHCFDHEGGSCNFFRFEKKKFTHRCVTLIMNAPYLKSAAS